MRYKTTSKPLSAGCANFKSPTRPEEIPREKERLMGHGFPSQGGGLMERNRQSLAATVGNNIMRKLHKLLSFHGYFDRSTES